MDENTVGYGSSTDVVDVRRDPVPVTSEATVRGMERTNVRRTAHRRITAVYPLARLSWNVYREQGGGYLKEVAPALVTDVIYEDVESWTEVGGDGRERHLRRPLDGFDPDERTVFASTASGYLEAADAVANYVGTFADEELPVEYR